jgi:hypothetical protein
MSLASYFPTEKLRLPLALVAAGAVLVGLVIAAGHLGLGLKEDFVLYRWFGPLAHRLCPFRRSADRAGVLRQPTLIC